ncbi:MAG: hypothetical protein GX974_01875 [Clostridiales bacterium]|nr:hypothetical protein [Clostridiales bacterium]
MGTWVKLLGYFTKRLTAIIFVIVVLIMATFIAYDCANIYVILEEGMALRADAVLSDAESTLLDKFFTQSFLNSDKLLNSGQYEDFDISSYDYKVKIKKVWAWPWRKNAEATIQEIVFDIYGKPKNAEQDEKREGEESPPPVFIPRWENGEKLVNLKKVNHRWIIDKVTIVRSLDEFD